jgi:putative redox protein
MGVKIEVAYQGELASQATHQPSGTELITDAPLDNGGRGQSFSPTDLVATALGTCIVTIMGLVGERHQLDLAGTTVQVEKEMVQHPHRRIGGLRTIVTVPAGACPDPAMRERLQNAASHCPVHRSLHPDIDAPIEFVWQ